MWQGLAVALLREGYFPLGQVEKWEGHQDEERFGLSKEEARLRLGMSRASSCEPP